jgi:hypothetical protein
MIFCAMRSEKPRRTAPPWRATDSCMRDPPPNGGARGAARDPHRRQRPLGGAHLHAQRLVRLTTDLADPNKAAGVFTTRGLGRKEIGGLTALLLALSLLLFSRLAQALSAWALAIAALSALNSLPRFYWKGRPLLSSTAHLVGGVLHFLLGYSLGNAIIVAASPQPLSSP